MPKGELTRERVIVSAADVFSTRGFFGTSMNDLLEQVGLQKGGLYNHFTSKEELALAAFDYTVERIADRFRTAVEAADGAVAQLRAVIDVIRSLVDDPIVRGGCPILNTAVEADDAHPALRDRARDAMTTWQKMIGSIVRSGVRSGELQPGADPRLVATVLTATLEGAVMLTKLYDDPVHMRRAVDHAESYVTSLAARRRRRGQ